MCPGLFQLLAALGALGLWPHHPRPPCLHMAPPGDSMSLALEGHLSLDLGPTLTQDDLIGRALIDFICKNLSLR